MDALYHGLIYKELMEDATSLSSCSHLLLMAVQSPAFYRPQHDADGVAGLTTLERPRPQIVAPSVPAGRPLRRAGIGAWLAVCVVAGGALRLWDLGSSRLSYDESFTAMAGRLPLSTLFAYLRDHDSHPPLDYLVRLPLARAGLDELWFRLPSALFSIAALILFACWMRSRGRLGAVATALMAFDAFQVQHGREARMYAEMELIGVASAMLATAWLTRPRRWHAPTLGVVVLLGLLTHTSMFLLASGLLVVPGRRRDGDAWRWRAAIGSAIVAWLALWGPAFVTQARGGHSSWIPRTSPSGLATAIARVTTFEPSLAVAACVAVAFGGFALWRSDHLLTRVWVCCFVVPVAVAAAAGLVEPVVLDRTFTVVSWAPLVAVAALVAQMGSRRAWLSAVAVVALLGLLLPSTLSTVTQSTGPDGPLRHLEQVVRPGDVVAVRPASKAPELQWSIGVRGSSSAHTVTVPGLHAAFALALGTGRPTGRMWLLDWRRHRSPSPIARAQCAPRWSWGHTRITCEALGNTGGQGAASSR